MRADRTSGSRGLRFLLSCSVITAAAILGGVWLASCGVTDGMAPGGCEYDKEWVTLDDWVYRDNNLSTTMYWGGMLKDGKDMYVAGTGSVSSTVRSWIVRKSSDNGATWRVVDEFQYLSTKWSQALAVEKKGSNIFVLGEGIDSADKRRVMVRKSSDGGGSWQTVLDYKHLNTYDTMVRDFKIVGNSIVIPAGCYGCSQYNWLVLKSDDDGATWQLIESVVDVDGVPSALDKGGFPYAIEYINGVLYAAGSSRTTNGIYSFAVRKSTDGGNTWQPTNENFKLYEGSSQASSYSIAGTGGAVFASGYAKDVNGKNHGIIRRSLDGGNNWSTVDDYVKQADKDTLFQSIAAAGSALYVAGKGGTSSGGSVWLVRRSVDGGQSWANVDEYAYSSDQKNNMAYTILVDGSDLYVGGYGVDTTATGRYHWIIRALYCRKK